MKHEWKSGLVAGIPIFLGYLSVSFGIGILASNAGLSVAEAVILSAANLTSAGQVAGIGIIAAGGSLLEIIATQFVINLRYALMALSLSQKLSPRFSLPHRLAAAYGITDEIFGVCAARQEPIEPPYMYGMILVAAAGWVSGTFLGAFAGVLLFGTVYGVLIGVVLSFIAVIINTANPKRSFLGVISGHEGFHSLERNTYSVPLKSAVIYRFSGNLYFANIKMFIADIEGALTDETRCVVVDSGAICNIDITAADRLAALDKQLKDRGITLCFASHIGPLNDRFRQLGIGAFVEEGRCRRTIVSALTAAGIRPPYELESPVSADKPLPYGNAERLEFEWAFGENAEEEMEKYTKKLLENIDVTQPPQQELTDVVKVHGSWNGVGDLDSEELLEHLQLHLSEISKKLGIPESQIEEAIERRKLRIAQRIGQRDPAAFARIKERTQHFEETLRRDDPKLYEFLISHRREAIKHLRVSEPEYAEMIEKLYGSSE